MLLFLNNKSNPFLEKPRFMTISYLKSTLEKVIMHYHAHHIINSIDRDVYNRILQQYVDVYIKDSPDVFSKYMNLSKFIYRALFRAHQLGLHKEDGLDILDIGTGAGYFPYVCEYLNHRCRSIDIDETDLYNQITALLNIDRTVYRVEPYKLLPSFPTRFDLITAYATNFNKYNKHSCSNSWGIPEWEFFLEDLRKNQLKIPGKLHLAINFGRDSKYFSKEVQIYFSQICKVRGSTIQCCLSEQGEWY